MEWIRSQETLLWWLFAASLSMLLVTPLIVAWLVVRLPTDYFTAERRHAPAWWERHRLLRPLALVVKNLLGVLLIAAGLVMFVTPGQGLLTLAVGIMLTNFPGKYRLERWMITRRPVWRAINWLRRKAGRTELQRPE